MLLKVNKAVFYFIVICFIAMLLPYFWDLGPGSLFFRDYLAKRIMTIISLPFFMLVLFLGLNKSSIKLNKNITAYLLVFVLVFINSFLHRNSVTLIILDSFVALLPVFFYLLVYKTTFSSLDYSNCFPIYLVIACGLVILNVKLQFSYFSMLGIIYIIFLTKPNLMSFILFLFFPVLVINTLIGKSALIMLLFMIAYFFLFDKNLVSKQKKLYLILIPSVFIIIGTIVFWDSIKKTGSYKNTTYFLSHTDFETLKFSDMSTGHRIYEAQRVLEDFKNSNIYSNLFGNGFGATIDLSETKDVAVMGSNSDLSKVRHIHIGLFAVLHRYGLIGVSIYLIFIIKLFRSCWRVLKNSNDYAIVLSALYLLVLLFDSFISFPHMMSNFMFWLIAFIMFYENDKINLNKRQMLSNIKHA
jgi:hypothetical protein